jgi:xylulokinase
MTPEPLLAGIDVGTSELKVCVLSASGTPAWQDRDRVIVTSPRPDHVEMDLDDLTAKLAALLRRMPAEHAAGVEAIGFSVTNPTLVILDRDLNALRPGIPFLDNRSATAVSAIVDGLGGPEAYFARVGNGPSPSTCTAGLIRHLQESEPNVWARAHRVGFLNTYLAAQFTGAVACDPTTASYSGLLDVRKPHAWDAELIRVSKLPGGLLPDLISSGSPVGGLCRSWAQGSGLRQGIPVAIGSGDTAAAAFALGMTRHGDVFESIGTSEVISFCLDHPDLDPAFMNRGHIIPGRWLSHGAVSTSGAAIAWLLKNVFPDIPDVGLLEQSARKSPPGANGLLFVPYLAGERSPIFDPQACGLFFGLSLKSTREDMIRAVYEGAGYAVKQINRKASTRWNIGRQTIPCVGGGAASSLSMQIRADMLGAELACIEAENAAAYGAAMLGGLASGVYPDIRSVPFLNAVSRRTTPDPERMEVYAQYFAVYDELYPQLKNSMHKLKKLVN